MQPCIKIRTAKLCLCYSCSFVFIRGEGVRFWEWDCLVNEGNDASASRNLALIVITQ
jgi:hypothetical protein